MLDHYSRKWKEIRRKKSPNYFWKNNLRGNFSYYSWTVYMTIYYCLLVISIDGKEQTQFCPFIPECLLSNLKHVYFAFHIDRSSYFYWYCFSSSHATSTWTQIPCKSACMIYSNHLGGLSVCQGIWVQGWEIFYFIIYRGEPQHHSLLYVLIFFALHHTVIWHFGRVVKARPC